MKLLAGIATVLCVIAPALARPSAIQDQNRETPERYTIVRCGWILDNPGQPPKRDVTLVVKNDKVHQVLEGLTGPDLAQAKAAGAQIQEIDLRSSFVLPGLIDCHVHLGTEMTSPDYRLRGVQESDGDTTVRAIVNARKTLDAGFTTVRDVGGRPAAIFAVRDGIARGDLVGPRILASGKSISVTGGHGDPTNALREELQIFNQPTDGVADGPSEAMKAVRHQIKLGADLIKITATGGVLSQSTAALGQHFTTDELNAIVFAAKAMGRKVAAHAHGTDGVNAALRAGVDSIEHGTYLDDESIRLFRETGAALVPTLLAGDTVARNAEIPGFYPMMVVRKAKEVGPRMIDMCRRAHQGGVKIAFGTDTGVSAHGENAREFALMAKAGMSPMECIVAATTTAAALCGLEGEIGALRPGMAADLIAVATNPLDDITALERVTFVMRAGAVHTPAGR